MIHQIILPRLHIPRGTEIHPILLAHIAHLLVRARQADDIVVELPQVVLQDLGRVARRITRDEHRQEDILALGLRLHVVDDGGHFVELVGADVGAVGEAEVDLYKC